MRVVAKSAGMLLRTLRTVAAAMFGVRAASRHKADGQGLSPILVGVAALVFMFLFVSVLVSLASGVAGK